MSDFSRRKFLKTGAAALAGITIAPSSILGMSHGHVSPTDKLNLAAVGIGGMGHANINNVKGTENIVALCDVDWKYAKGVFDEFPNAKKYWDYRKMYDEMGKSIDGVIIATADHTHAIITADAMTMGKHVYCQKPLTHSVYESRLLTKLAASTGVVTQMGNQGASGEGTDLVCEWIWNGEIGEVTKVECATDRPIWPQGLNAPEKADRIPNTLNWDLFTGPAKLNPYNNVYHPWNWRGWWDYGTGALGDMACHILHQPFRALKLGYPTKVEGSSTLLLSACAPQAQHVKMIFPARDNMPLYEKALEKADPKVLDEIDTLEQEYDRLCEKNADLWDKVDEAYFNLPDDYDFDNYDEVAFIRSLSFLSDAEKDALIADYNRLVELDNQLCKLYDTIWGDTGCESGSCPL